MSSSPGSTRRGFLLGTAAGLAAGAPLTYYALRALHNVPLAPMPVAPETSSALSGRPAGEVMPGRYPGRVVEVHDPTSVTPDHEIIPTSVDRMVDAGMAELTGYEPGDHVNSWKALFQKGDVVGIKVNPVGRRPLAGEPGRVKGAVGSISSPALVVKVVKSLEAVGIPRRDIVIFERYANEFCEAGYKDLCDRELPGVRWMTAAAGYSSQQLDIRGRDPDSPVMAADVDSHIVGYDPDVFTTMGFCDPRQSPRDDRRFRSHLSMVVSRLVDKVITLPVLKDHRSGGVTLSLKNMSHGMNNNVARSHLSGLAHGVIDAGGKVLGPNQCNTFIPQAVNQLRLKEKMTLHILDGLIAVYEGGPGSWNKTWGTWRRRSIFFATDPVAMDHVGWDVIDAERARHGWAPVAKMGSLYRDPSTQVVTAAGLMAATSPLAAAGMAQAVTMVAEGRGSEAFNVRQPDHVVLAGQMGLGVFESEGITYRRIRV